MMGHFRLALRTLRQDWRHGPLAGVFWALAIAIAALTAVNVTGERAQRALNAQAHQLLGADLVLESRKPIAAELVRQAQRAGLETAQTVTFRTVVFAGERSLLAAVKAVTPEYPLRGELRIADTPFGSDRPASAPPAPDTVWAAPRVFSDLQLNPGDTLAIGNRELPVAQVLAFEPDRAGSFAGLAPRVMMRLADARAARLLVEGSRATYRLLVAGAPERVSAFAEAVREQPVRLITPDQAQQQNDSAMRYASRYFGLSALSAVLIAGVGILLAGLRYARSQQRPVALLRSFGTHWREVLTMQLTRLALLALAAAALGIAAGYAIHLAIAARLAGLFAVGLPAPGWQPALLSLAYGLLLTGGFTLPAILDLRRAAPMQILQRGEPPPGRGWWLGAISGLAALALLTVIQLADWPLAAWSLAALLGAVIALAVAARLLVAAARRGGSGLGPVWRLGLSGLERRTHGNVLQMTGVGLGLTAILLLSIVRAGLFDTWQTSLEPGTPNRFLLNIQPDQKEAVLQFLEQRQVVNLQSGPMAVTRLEAINGQDPEAWRPDLDPPGERSDGTLNISWQEQLPAANEVVSGEWRSNKVTGAQFSVAETWAESVGVGIGDTLTFGTGDQRLSGTITSLRAVDWDSFRVNFFILINPAATEGIDHQYIASYFLPPERGAVLRELAQRFPNVTILDAEAIVARVREVLGNVSRAVTVVFGFTLAAGLVVLLTAIQAGMGERRRETAVLRATGASRGLLVRAQLVEFGSLGLLTGLLASTAAAVGGAVLGRQLFNLDWQPHPGLFAAGTLAGLLLIPVSGWLATRRVLRTSPLAVLRAQE